MSTGPGWFPDPWQRAPWRWWDGLQWTAYTWPAAVPYDLSPASLAVARRKEATLLKWAKLGLASVLVGGAGSWINTFTISHAVRTTFDQFGQYGQDTNGQYVVFNQDQSGWWTLSTALGAVALGLGVVFLVWQHSAAIVARSLGFPARVSPGAGVASWFIPIGNFWRPYWALSDLLPPDHPMRPLCLRAWLAWMGSTLVNVIAFFLALVSTDLAVVVLVIGTALVIYAFTTGRRLIDAVYLDHTRRMAMFQH